MREKTAVFVVRLWAESGEGEGTTWRGVVIHVPTGERLPVRSFEEVTQVMATYLPPDEEDGGEANPDSGY